MPRKTSTKQKSIIIKKNLPNATPEPLLTIDENVSKSKRNSNSNIKYHITLQDEHYLNPSFKAKRSSKEMNKAGNRGIKIGKASSEFISLQNIEEEKQLAIHLEESSLDTSHESIFSSRHPSHSNLMAHNDKKSSSYLNIENQNQTPILTSNRLLIRNKRDNDSSKENTIRHRHQTLLTTENNTLEVPQQINKTKVRSLNLIQSKRSSLIDQPNPEVLKKTFTTKDLQEHIESFEAENPTAPQKRYVLAENENHPYYLKPSNPINNTTPQAPIKNRPGKHLSSGRRLFANQSSSKRTFTENPKSIFDTDPSIQHPQTLTSFVNDNYHDSSINITINEMTQEICQIGTAKPRVLKKLKGKSSNTKNENSKINQNIFLKENDLTSKADFTNLPRLTPDLGAPLRPLSNNANRIGSHSKGNSISKSPVLTTSGRENLMKRFNDIVSHSTKPSISQLPVGVLRNRENERKGISTQTGSKSNMSTRANSKTAETKSSQMNTDDKIKFLKEKIKDCENLRKKRKNGYYRENEPIFGQTNLKFTQTDDEEEKDLEEDFKRKLLISKKVQLYDLLIQQKLVGKKLTKDALRHVKTEFNKVSAGLDELKV